MENIENKPEDVFAYTFKTLVPQFSNIINGLGAKAKVRVINTIMQHPLLEKPMNLKSEAEVTACNLGMQILEAKYAMIMIAQMQAVEAQEKNAHIPEAEVLPAE